MSDHGGRNLTRWAWLTLPLALAAFPLTMNGCMSSDAADGAAAALPGVTRWAALPTGTPLTVRFTGALSSETARAGDGWSGTVVSPVMVGSDEIIPAGSEVRGVVTDVIPAKRGNRALLDLDVRSVIVDGRPRPLLAGAEPIIAGSPRARNLAGIAGGAAAGALIGKAVGGDGKDAAIGGLIGGAAATGVVAKSKGYQVRVRAGSVLRFTVNEQLASL